MTLSNHETPRTEETPIVRTASSRALTIAVAAAAILLTGCVSTGEYRTGMDGVNAQIEAMRLSREEFDRRQAILDTKIKAIEESPAPAANLDQQVRNLTGQLDRANGRIAELERMLREKTDALTKENQALRELIRQESDDLNEAIRRIQK